MNGKDLFVSAVADEVATRFKAGAGYLRVPLLSRTMAADALVPQIREQFPGLRIAVFLAQFDADPGDELLTTDVAQAVTWRDTEGDLLVIGDLEHDRAAGLRRIPIVHGREIQIRLFNGAAQQVSAKNLKQLLLA